MLVRIKGRLSNPATIIATRVRQVSLLPAVKENQQVEVEGIINRFTSATSFEVNGLPVTVANNARVEGIPALGSRVEVEGKITNNVLVASKVETKDETRVKDDANEFHGAISSIDTASQTFTLRNGTVTVKWDGNTVFDNSSLPRGAADLATNLGVEVKGKVAGNVLLASKIERDR
jgi:hypothetical protein